MNPKIIILMLVLMALLAAGLYLLGDSLPRPFREKAEAWLEKHGDEAERRARRALHRKPGEIVDLGRDLGGAHARVVGDAVSFLLQPGGFGTASRGVCYTPTGAPPLLGIRDTPPTEWEHLYNGWYLWSASDTDDRD